MDAYKENKIAKEQPAASTVCKLFARLDELRERGSRSPRPLADLTPQSTKLAGDRRRPARRRRRGENALRGGTDAPHLEQATRSLNTKYPKADLAVVICCSWAIAGRSKFIHA
jgi:hypothetical protein